MTVQRSLFSFSASSAAIDRVLEKPLGMSDFEMIEEIVRFFVVVVVALFCFVCSLLLSTL